MPSPVHNILLILGLDAVRANLPVILLLLICIPILGAVLMASARGRSKTGRRIKENNERILSPYVGEDGLPTYMETTTDYTRAVKAADFKPRSQTQGGQDFDFTFRK
jgi:hypothetical protein